LIASGAVESRFFEGLFGLGRSDSGPSPEDVVRSAIVASYDCDVAKMQRLSCARLRDEIGEESTLCAEFPAEFWEEVDVDLSAVQFKTIDRSTKRAVVRVSGTLIVEGYGIKETEQMEVLVEVLWENDGWKACGAAHSGD
jgi:hypothetical protein